MSGFNCYVCDRAVSSLESLSPRHRCVYCEYRRALFNEEENDVLRASLEKASAEVEILRQIEQILNNHN